MQPDRPAVRKVALDLHFVGVDGPLAGDADPVGPGAISRHAAVLLRERAVEDLLADAVEQVIGLAHGTSSSTASAMRVVIMPRQPG